MPSSSEHNPGEQDDHSTNQTTIHLQEDVSVVDDRNSSGEVLKESYIHVSTGNEDRNETSTSIETKDENLTKNGRKSIGECTEIC